MIEQTALATAPQTALRVGLVIEVVPDDQLRGRA